MTRHTWWRVVQKLKNWAQTYKHPYKMSHFAALINRRGQVLSTGVNSCDRHAEVDAVQRYLSRWKVQRGILQPKVYSARRPRDALRQRP